MKKIANRVCNNFFWADELGIFYLFRVQAPYTNSWKSDEAVTEIANFQEKLDYVKNGVEEHDIKDNIENYDEKVKELQINLDNLKDIWEVVTDWEELEAKVHIKFIKDLNINEVIDDLDALKEEVKFD